MLKALKNASKRTRTRLVAATLALLAALAAALSIYAATDTTAAHHSKHALLAQHAPVAKGGVEGLHEAHAPTGGSAPVGHGSTGGAQPGTIIADVPTTRDAGTPASLTNAGKGSRSGASSSPTGPKPDPQSSSPAGPTKSREGASFSISGRPDGSLALGGDPSTIPLTLANPNGVAIHVISLQTTVSGGARGCAAAKNIVLTQANVSGKHALAIPAHGRITLPADGIAAPTIQLIDLPVDQDACREARFALQYRGRAES